MSPGGLGLLWLLQARVMEPTVLSDKQDQSSASQPFSLDFMISLRSHKPILIFGSNKESLGIFFSFFFINKLLVSYMATVHYCLSFVLRKKEKNIVDKLTHTNINLKNILVKPYKKKG